MRTFPVESQWDKQNPAEATVRRSCTLPGNIRLLSGPGCPVCVTPAAVIDAVLELMQFIYENIMYAELNTKSDYCMKCGYDGEIQIVEEEDQETHKKKLVWECPNCHNRDQNQMSVARRTCGLTN